VVENNSNKMLKNNSLRKVSSRRKSVQHKKGFGSS
jgi:hypothetical protein